MKKLIFLNSSATCLLFHLMTTGNGWDQAWQELISAGKTYEQVWVTLRHGAIDKEMVSII